MENEIDYEEEQEAQAHAAPVHNVISDLINKLDDVPFTIEHLQNAYLLRTSPYQALLLKKIISSTLSYNAKQALLLVTNGYLDQTVFLSNLSTNKGFVGKLMGNMDTEKAEIVFNLIAIELRLSFDPLDTNRPELINIMGMLKSHIQFVLTRTVGDKREGVVQHERPIKIDTETTYGRRESEKPKSKFNLIN